MSLQNDLRNLSFLEVQFLLSRQTTSLIGTNAKAASICVKSFSLHMHVKPSFAHRLQTAKMASSRTIAQNNCPKVQNNGPKA